MPLVYIIVLNYKMRDVVARCLASLQSLDYPNFRVVVVDNMSGDGVLEMVRRRFPDAVTIQTGGNLGYTGGNNRGIEAALAAGAAYVLVLNPDTEVVNPAFLTEMVRYAELHPEAGIVGPRVYLRRQGVVQNTVLFAPGLWRNLANWVHFRLHPSAFALSGDAVVEAETLNGVCVLLRAACLRQIGLFDARMFMYIEDAEMNWRARREGWRVRYLPIESVVHVQKTEGYHMTGPVAFLLKRNSVYYLCKTGRRLEAWGYALCSLALLLLRGLATLRGEHFSFAKRLGLAYRAILLRRSSDADFGPTGELPPALPHFDPPQ
jgi:GT2 family glycosyltransferase